MLATLAKAKARTDLHGDDLAQVALLKTCLQCIPRLMPTRMMEREVCCRVPMVFTFLLHCGCFGGFSASFRPRPLTTMVPYCVGGVRGKDPVIGVRVYCATDDAPSLLAGKERGRPYMFVHAALICMSYSSWLLPQRRP